MNEIRKINCGRDKWLEGKREEVSSLESEIKRIRPKEISHFGLGRKGEQIRTREKREGRKEEEEEEEEDYRYGI